MLEIFASLAILVMVACGVWAFCARKPKPVAADTNPEEYALGYDTGFDDGNADKKCGLSYDDEDGDEGPNPCYRRGYYEGYYKGFMGHDPAE
jgi:hypothetical protein